jgi:hypothetical protein
MCSKNVYDDIVMGVENINCRIAAQVKAVRMD